MKLLPTLFLIVFSFSTALAGEARPAVPLKQALKQAEQYLDSRKLGDEVFIESIELEKAGAFSKERIWKVYWSHEIPPLETGGDKETGVKITMSGDLIRLSKKK